MVGTTLGRLWVWGSQYWMDGVTQSWYMFMEWWGTQGRLNFMLSCDCRAEDVKETDQNEDGNELGEFQGMWENMGMTCLTVLKIPHIGILAYLIKRSICQVRDHPTIRPVSTLKSHILILLTPMSPHVTRSQPPLSDGRIMHVTSLLSNSACHVHELPLHSESMQDPLSPTPRLSVTSHLSYPSTPCYTQLTTFPELWDNHWIESPPPVHHPPDLPPLQSPPALTPPLLIEHHVQSASPHLLHDVDLYTTKVASESSRSISLSPLDYAL